MHLLIDIVGAVVVVVAGALLLFGAVSFALSLARGWEED